MNWTTEKPTVPGWYWHKLYDGQIVVTDVMECPFVTTKQELWCCYGFVDRLVGEFAGPLEPPQEGEGTR